MSEPAAGPPAGSALRGGFASVNITPPLGVSMEGYIGLDRMAAGIADELYARAMVLSDGVTRLAIVSCDLLGLARESVSRMRQLIEAATGIPPEAVLIACTHNHTGPQAIDLYRPKDEGYHDQLIRKVASAVRMANDQLGPVQVGVGFGSEPTLCYNRRILLKDGRAAFPALVPNPEDVASIEGPTDPTVGVLSFADAQGRLRGVIVNYATHVDVITGDYISADYPGVMVDVLRKVYGPELITFFMAGACADIDPIGYGDPRLQTRAHYGDPEGASKAQQIGTILAAEALKVLARTSYQSVATLAATSHVLRLATRKPSAEQVREAERVLADPDAAVAADAAHGNIPTVQLMTRARNLAKAVLRFAEFQSTHSTLPVEIQALRIGELALVGIPGELFAALGMQIQAELAPRRCMVLTYSNDYLGYIPSLVAYEHGGYETMPGWANQLEPDSGPRMVSEAVAMVHNIYLNDNGGADGL